MCGGGAHSPVVCAEQARLLVLVAHGAEVAADDLKVGVLADIVDGHLEHAQVKERDRAEGPAGDEDDWLLVGVAEGAAQTVVREGIVWGVGERRWGRRGRGRCGRRGRGSKRVHGSGREGDANVAGEQRIILYS